MKNNQATNSNTATQQGPLRNVVAQTLQNYFTHLDPNTPPTSLYDFVIKEVEIPLLEKALNYTKGNQFKAALMLGISRNTLRRKISLYNLNS